MEMGCFVNALSETAAVGFFNEAGHFSLDWSRRKTRAYREKREPSIKVPKSWGKQGWNP